MMANLRRLANSGHFKKEPLQRRDQNHYGPIFQISLRSTVDFPIIHKNVSPMRTGRVIICTAPPVLMAFTTVPGSGQALRCL